MELSGIDLKILHSREEPIYKEIEQCKTSYELRYVIAYEAAIRNQTIKELLNLCIIANDDESYRKLKSMYGFTDQVIFYYRITHKDLFPIDDFDKKISGLSAIELNNNVSLQPYVLTPLCAKNDTVVLNDTPIHIDNGDIAVADISDYDDFEKLSLEYRFLRPKLTPIKSKKFFVELNFEIPVTELIEYIELLHKLYHKHGVPSAAELLNDRIEFSNDKQTRAVAKKYADMLYVYDYIQYYCDEYKNEVELHQKIAEDLSYSTERDDSPILSTNTIRNYALKMNELISEYGYLTLLTGIEQ